MSDRILVTMRSESDDWYTPPLYVEAARTVMGTIDLDPASCAVANLHVKATSIYTQIEDGLTQPWAGNVWLNPPFGGNSGDFVKHLIEQYKAGNVTQAITCVSSNGTTAKWFQPLWEFPVCFTNHRPKFLGGPRNKGNEPASPTNGIVFAYLGPDEELFAKTFSEFGPIVKCVTQAAPRK